MVRRITGLAVAVLVGSTLFATTALAGEHANGEKLFKRSCAACHSTEAGVNKIGPSLAGVVGRMAGAVEGYRYSKAMQAYGMAWSEETLSSFLEDPRDEVEGTKMTFRGFKDESERKDVIAYLKTLSN